MRDFKWFLTKMRFTIMRLINRMLGRPPYPFNLSYSVIIGDYAVSEHIDRNIRDIVVIGPHVQAGPNGSIRIGSGSKFLEIRFDKNARTIELCGGHPDEVIKAVQAGMDHALKLLVQAAQR